MTFEITIRKLFNFQIMRSRSHFFFQIIQCEGNIRKNLWQCGKTLPRCRKKLQNCVPCLDPYIKFRFFVFALGLLLAPPTFVEILRNFKVTILLFLQVTSDWMFHKSPILPCPWASNHEREACVLLDKKASVWTHNKPSISLTYVF